MKKIIFSLIALLPLAATAESYDDFIIGLEKEMVEKGLDPQILRNALGDMPAPNKKVLQKLVKQPESTFSFQKYFSRMVSQPRTAKGRERYQKHQTELQEISKKYGIPAETIVALWGVETYYGKYTGGFQVIPSLVTVAYDSHRKDFFRRELFHALKIIQDGHVTADGFKGSWAGATGQCQFMPSSFMSYAVDGDGDGKKDIWTTEKDVFASAANYLKRHGWDASQKWGQRVVLSKILPPIKFSKRDLSDKKTVAEWQQLGVNAAQGGYEDTSRLARLFLPEGPSGKAYLVYNNFEVIMKWNRSSYFAFSVLMLSDAIAK